MTINFKIKVTMKVVVGQGLRTRYADFYEQMRYVIFARTGAYHRRSRERKLPKLQRDPAYLTKEDMEVVDLRENVVGSGRGH